MRINAPFHEGELSIQRRANEAELARRNGSVIADAIPKGALRFIGQQPLAVFGSLDPEGNVWASVLVGEPGFLSAPDERVVELDVMQRRSAEDDPFWTNIETNEAVGMLVIDLATRRRLRINGQIRRLDDKRLILGVDQAYPNCPKYIQRRHLSRFSAIAPSRLAATRRGIGLGDDQRALIASADTLFIASANPEHGVDASHRGGQPGFVRVLDDRRIRIPDYVGNSMFNTLGNFATYSHAGVVFVDFDRSRALQLTGRANVLWDQEDPDDETGGTRRFWDLEVERWLEVPLPRQLRWELLDHSPYNPKLQRESSVEKTTPKLAVTRIRQETDCIKSFRLAPVDGSTLPPFAPGAHLPVSVRLPGGERAQRRYSILSSPSDRSHYEIAVLLESDGRGGSRFMHEQVRANDIIDAGMPRNDFPLETDALHSILIAGGIGITPILSMLRSLATKQASFEVHYAARSASNLAYWDEVEALSAGQARFYLSEGPTAARLNLDELLSTPRPGTHVYVCGPVRMIEAVRELAAKHGWSPKQIHFESFGARSTANDREITVRLAQSHRTISVPPSQTILDALLEANIGVPYDCKRGECGMCVTEVLYGQPDHRDVCLTRDERERSMCLCVSRAKGGNMVLDL
jgi:ferredoxin-NADP reductase/predicted pyridoxine 5'-phosphate oxidase superfamily flavin-nucleotide-binding protein